VLKNPDGSARGLVGVAMDITARKQAENALRDANETLERRVTERTSELEHSHDKVLAEIRQREQVEDQLRQAQKMEIIGQLTGGVAHDFNNLLMAVLSNLDLLRKHVGDDARATRFIDSALQGAKRGAALTQRLLAFARRQSLKVEPVSLGALAEACATCWSDRSGRISSAFQTRRMRQWRWWTPIKWSWRCSIWS
jgi:C4-dicarboxylate-specific signal transduction histidine kinase